MKRSEWNEGLNQFDADLVENYVEQKDNLRYKKRVKNIWLRVGAVAACLALLISAVAVAPKLKLGGFQSSTESAVSEVPILEDGHYSARDIAKLFDSRIQTDGVATNAYTKKFVPDAKYLYINEIPDDEYLNLYKYNTVKKELDKQEFKVFVDDILPKVSAAIGVDTPEYKIQVSKVSSEFLDAQIDITDYYLSLKQRETYSSVTLSSMRDDDSVYLDGKRIQVDQRLSDEEVINSIESIKQKLFDVFGASFSNVKVIRKYGEHSEYGVEWLYIYFYNENKYSFNNTDGHPASDYIRISFDNFKNHPGDIVSDSVLTVASVSYIKYRTSYLESYKSFAKAKRISLEEAEELLYKGYVFGGHSCPLCMAAQEKVDFEGYDLVGIEYIGSIPFYAFYKNIGTARNGNIIYAKTFVPAIKVSGYEEYFESQKAYH